MPGRLDLLRQTPLAMPFADHPIVAVDIGARGGFEPDLHPLAFAVDAIGFEPEPTAFAALPSTHAWRSLRYLPVAVSGTGGTRTLHITRDGPSTTLLEPDPEVGAAFGKTQFVEVERRVEIETATLGEALSRAGVAHIDYLKLDVEGAELEILKGAAALLEHALVVKAEVAFVAVRRGQPVAADIERHLASCGFALMDFIRPAHWRMDGYIIHPQIGSGSLPYSRGQLIHGDYLFFRQPSTIREPRQALRAAALALAHGYIDHAAVLLRRPDVGPWLAQAYGLDVERALREASRRLGRYEWAAAAWRHLRGLSPFVRSFFRLIR